MTIVDIYCHIYPDRFFQEMTKAAPNLENIGKRLRGVTKLFDLDARFKEMDEFGDYREIISLPNPAIEDIAPPDVGLNLARIANDSMAELCRKHPDRFPAFAAALCLTDVEGSVAEARRAIKDLGARGVLIYTNVAGEPLDQPKFEPIFATMAELDLPVWLHPVGTAAMPDYPAEKKSRFEMWWCFHWPYETSVAMVRHGVLGTVRPLSETEDHHASPRWHDPVLRRPRRRRPEGSWATDFGRGLFKNPAVAEATAHGLSARVLCRHGNVRRWPARNADAGSNFSAPIRWCMRPIRRSARLRRRSRPSTHSGFQTRTAGRSFPATRKSCSI